LVGLRASRQPRLGRRRRRLHDGEDGRRGRRHPPRARRPAHRLDLRRSAHRPARRREGDLRLRAPGAMIVFLTLYLGLVSGKQPLALKVDANVKSVRIVIDGTPLATLIEPPWRAEIDFGPALLPHEVDAVGLDAGGKEIARALQFVNVPRPSAEAEIVVDRNADGRPARAKVV